MCLSGTHISVENDVSIDKKFFESIEIEFRVQKEYFGKGEVRQKPVGTSKRVYIAVGKHD